MIFRYKGMNVQQVKNIYDLTSINIHNTEELKEALTKKGLIKEDFSDYLNYGVIYKKDSKVEQLDLDHFLNL